MWFSTEAHVWVTKVNNNESDKTELLKVDGLDLCD